MYVCIYLCMFVLLPMMYSNPGMVPRTWELLWREFSLFLLEAHIFSTFIPYWKHHLISPRRWQLTEENGIGEMGVCRLNFTQKGSAFHVATDTGSLAFVNWVRQSVPVSQSVSQSVSEWVSEWVSGWVSLWVSEWASGWASQSVSESVTRSPIELSGDS